MTARKWMIYGCNGYTGRLVVEQARRLGLAPVLAGRRQEAIRSLAHEADLPWRTFQVDDAAAADAALADIDVLLVVAGPFSATSAPLLDACLRTGTAYLDLNGDVEVIGATFARRDEVAKAGGVAIPAVGFDVAPSDCLAALVCERLPGAERLDIAWGGDFQPSRGTARSMLEAFPRGGLARRDGRLVRIPVAARVREIPFPTGDRHAVTVPWGDLVTSAFSAGVPNVTTYAAMPRAAISGMRTAGRLHRLFGIRPVARALDAIIAATVTGPSADLVRTGRAWFWAQAVRGDEYVTGTFGGPEGYLLTARAAVAAVQRVLAGTVRRTGVLTVSEAFGADFAATIEGCAVRVHAGESALWPAVPEPASEMST